MSDTQHCGVMTNHAAHQFEGHANAFRRTTMFCPGTQHAASGWVPGRDWPLIESHPRTPCDGLCEHARKAEMWAAESQRQAALFQAETLTSSYLAQRLRGDNPQLCSFCARHGAAVWVGPGSTRYWLCETHLNSRAPRFAAVVGDAPVPEKEGKR